ncbi:winged helix-turn-helix domain-containing protein [Devosia nitrariae]|uniref:DNA-binding response regulator n=1 Tax=Devosia nitrariae TaxID=2071872 RepID=A0ABQ5W6X2_9HYPH|nr:winged helix-turn-helix domain-containing protein [Devosia nitrariae]GLQ55824.1 DNA-binding response regulator [Devosia nitrariae]
MTLRILVIDTDAEFTSAIYDHFEHNGDIVDVTERADEAKLKISELPPDLVVLAWRLADASGIELCRQLRLRRDSAQLPIIMLTERTDEAARVRCLETGADDVLTKPVSTSELLAHVNAVVRRHRPHLIVEALRLGGIELNRFTHRVQYMGRELKMSPVEFRLLMKLMENSGRIMPRALLLDQVWGSDVYINERTVDVHIARLRSCLRGTTADNAIQTVRGLGYSFVA